MTGFDIDPKKVDMLNRGKSYIRHISAAELKEFLGRKMFKATTDFRGLRDVDAILICVPTPLDGHRSPDLSYVLNSTISVAEHLRKGQLVVLESTTYPGTTDEEMLPILEAGGLKGGQGLLPGLLARARGPGQPEFLDGDNAQGRRRPDARLPARGQGPLRPDHRQDRPRLLDPRRPSRPSSSRTSSARVNIALVNELKMIFERMDIDVWEVIRAASSKPFGFMPFYPGPGLGGHCIPIDPFYLTWKAQEVDYQTKFIELAGEINTFMPYYVVRRRSRP